MRNRGNRRESTLSQRWRGPTLTVGLPRALIAAIKGPSQDRMPTMGGSIRGSRSSSGRGCRETRLDNVGVRYLPIGLLLTAIAAVALSSGSAAAQQPGRTITIVVPFTPGTGPDILARVMGEEIQQRWSQPVVIENKPGASGNIGTQAVARSAPDGHTLLLTTSPFTQNVSPVQERALRPGDRLCAYHPARPMRSWRSRSILRFRQHRRRSSSPISRLGPDRSTTPPRAAARRTTSPWSFFKLATGTNAQACALLADRRPPCRTWSAAMSVRCSYLCMYGLPLAKDKQIRLLAVADKTRVSVAPDVPTLPEQGITGVDIDFWLGMLAPAGTARRDGRALQCRPQRHPAHAADRREAVGAGFRGRRRHLERLCRPHCA